MSDGLVYSAIQTGVWMPVASAIIESLLVLVITLLTFASHVALRYASLDGRSDYAEGPIIPEGLLAAHEGLFTPGAVAGLGCLWLIRPVTSYAFDSINFPRKRVHRFWMQGLSLLGAGILTVVVLIIRIPSISEIPITRTLLPNDFVQYRSLLVAGDLYTFAARTALLLLFFGLSCLGLVSSICASTSLGGSSSLSIHESVVCLTWVTGCRIFTSLCSSVMYICIWNRALFHPNEKTIFNALGGSYSKTAWQIFHGHFAIVYLTSVIRQIILGMVALAVAISFLVTLTDDEFNESSNDVELTEPKSFKRTTDLLLTTLRTVQLTQFKAHILAGLNPWFSPLLKIDSDENYLRAHIDDFAGKWANVEPDRSSYSLCRTADTDGTLLPAAELRPLTRWTEADGKLAEDVETDEETIEEQQKIAARHCSGTYSLNVDEEAPKDILWLSQIAVALILNLTILHPELYSRPVSELGVVGDNHWSVMLPYLLPLTTSAGHLFGLAVYLLSFRFPGNPINISFKQSRNAMASFALTAGVLEFLGRLFYFSNPPFILMPFLWIPKLFWSAIGVLCRCFILCTLQVLVLIPPLTSLIRRCPTPILCTVVTSIQFLFGAAAFVALLVERKCAEWLSGTFTSHPITSITFTDRMSSVDGFATEVGFSAASMWPLCGALEFAGPAAATTTGTKFFASAHLATYRCVTSMALSVVIYTSVLVWSNRLR